MYYGLSDEDMLRCQLPSKPKDQPHPVIASQTESMSDVLSHLIASEAAKRNRHWDAHQRWKVLQETIDWVDSQAVVPRNSKAGCLANQARLLAAIAKQDSTA